MFTYTFLSFPFSSESVFISSLDVTDSTAKSWCNYALYLNSPTVTTITTVVGV